VDVAGYSERTIEEEAKGRRRARLYWQCRRGMLELDLVLQAFLDHHYDQVPLDERLAFETLLNYPDALLLEYVMGRMIPTDKHLADVVARLRAPAPL
jgi:antitoxin CptB